MMRKNILIFGQLYATQFIDISNQYTALFDPARYSVTVVYLVDKPNDEVKQRHLAKDVIFLDSPAKSTRRLKLYAIKKMMQLQKEKQFEIVICHRYKPSYIMLWVAQFFKIPALFFVMHELNTLRNFSRKCIVACLWKKNMYFAGVSDAVRHDILQSIWRVPHDHIITLLNAIDVSYTESQLFEQKAARAYLKLLEHDFVFGASGRLVKAKDHATLIKAFALAKSSCPNAKLIIMGHGEMETDLKQLISDLHLTDNVLLCGFIPNAFRYMKALDVFILNSIQEAFGRVLLEAMIAKVPILATKVNGIPEVVGNAGILIEPKDSKLLANKMIEFYNMEQNERITRGLKAYQRVKTHFSTDSFNKVFWKLPIVHTEALS